MKKYLIGLALIGLLVVGVFSYATKENRQVPAMTKIGISQIAPYDVLDTARQEMISFLAKNGYVEGKNLYIDYQNAAGDMNVNQAIAKKFAGSDYNLFVAITTPSSQALANAIKDRPIVFAAVSDPVKAGLVTDLKHPNNNITGTSDITLYKEQLSFLKSIQPNVRTLGIIYNPSEPAAQTGIEKVNNLAAEYGLQIITATANTTTDVLPAARSIVSKVDAFYIIPDNTVISGQDALIRVALENKKPLIAYEESGVEKGALATLSTNYADLGKHTGDIIVQVLQGKKPGDIPVLGVTDAYVFLNTTTAKTLGINLPDNLVQRAKKIYQ